MTLLGLTHATVTVSAHISELNHQEAGRLASVELDRFLNLVGSLEGDDWKQPTGCTEWSVRDILAHQAGSYAAYGSWAEFRRQYLQNPYMKEADEPVNGINRRQLEDRTGQTPKDLLAELHEVGPRALRTRQRLPWLLRKLPVPFGPPIGVEKVEWLTDLILLRDTWMHRLEICRATGRAFVQTAEHDGRIQALIMRDLVKPLKQVLGDSTIIYELSGGPAGGVYCYGPGREADAVLHMNLFDFNWLASERMTAAEAREYVTVDGDEDLAERVLANTVVIY